jgi:hypothetical protein
MLSDVGPELAVVRNAIRQQVRDQREIRRVTSPAPWRVLTLARFLCLVREASQGCDGGPTLHFFSGETPVRDNVALRERIASSRWHTLDDLDELLRRAEFLGTLRVTQAHRLDDEVEEVVARCLKVVETSGDSVTGEASLSEREQTLTRFFHRHGGVNAYYTMHDSGRAIPFHRDPGDVFAFQAYGAKIWELGSSTTLYGGSYCDASDEVSLRIELTVNEMLFLPRGVRHRACVPKGMRSLHYVLMLDTCAEYWVLSGLAETLRAVPHFNGGDQPSFSRSTR